jgi:hypothetical protein
MRLFRDRVEFAVAAKYPIRPWAVLTPEQLSAARGQLGSAAPFVAPLASHRDVDRRPLTRDELHDARARRIADAIVGDDAQADLI